MSVLEMFYYTMVYSLYLELMSRSFKDTLGYFPFSISFLCRSFFLVPCEVDIERVISCNLISLFVFFQPKYDTLQVLELMREYSGLLSTFPEMVNVHKVIFFLNFCHCNVLLIEKS